MIEHKPFTTYVKENLRKYDSLGQWFSKRGYGTSSLGWKPVRNVHVKCTESENIMCKA